MTAWVVRAGRHGENEQYNLDHGRATIGWAGIGDLAGCRTRDDVKALLEAAVPGMSQGRLSNNAGQLWAFRSAIEPGDLIVMPLKSKPGYIHFGRVTGPYGFDADNPDLSRRKCVPVEWDSEPVPRSVIGQDLLYSLGAIQTVFSPSRNNAAARLEAIAKTGSDPGNPDDEVAPVDDRIGSSDVTDPDPTPTLESISDRVRAHVAAQFREHRLTDLVADILTVLGFTCETSPPGPDGGVDILAGRGPLGLDAPTLIVEVKSEPSPIDVKVVRGLHSAMVQHKADQGLLVAWGGVTKPARKEFERDRTTFRVWDAEALMAKLFETYDRLPAATRSEIPLRQVWVLDDDETGN